MQICNNVDYLRILYVNSIEFDCWRLFFFVKLTKLYLMISKRLERRADFILFQLLFWNYQIYLSIYKRVYIYIYLNYRKKTLCQISNRKSNQNAFKFPSCGCAQWHFEFFAIYMFKSQINISWIYLIFMNHIKHVSANCFFGYYAYVWKYHTKWKKNDRW